MRMRVSAIGSFVIILCLLLSNAYADEPKLHLLWDIPFGCSARDVSTYVSINKGIYCIRTMHAPTAIMPQYESLDSDNDEELFLYGIPFHFSFSEYTNNFTLTFAISGDSSDFDDAANTLLSALSQMYGVPDVAYKAIGDGAQQNPTEWSVLSSDCILPFSHFSDAIAESQGSVTGDVYIRFLNVVFNAKYDPDNGSVISISYNSDTQDAFGLPGSDTL